MLKSMCISLVILGFILITGCGTNGPKPPAISLPAKFTMEMPSMNETGSQKVLAKTMAEPTCSAYTVSALGVTFWAVAVNLALFTPRVLFYLCHSTEPEPLDDNSGWKWTVGNAVHSAELIGRIESDSVRWHMTVNGPNLDNFKWYDGTSTITGKNGYWTLCL
jgi:hypothetical protein